MIATQAFRKEELAKATNKIQTLNCKMISIIQLSMIILKKEETQKFQKVIILPI